MIKSGNCTFSLINGNEIYEIVKITCSGYEDEFVKVLRSMWISLENFIENDYVNP